MGQKARQFLDEEAELSEDEEGADVSSDEEDGAELNRSLEGFVVDNTHLSQGLDGNLLDRLRLLQIYCSVYLLWFCSSPHQTQRCREFT